MGREQDVAKVMGDAGGVRMGAVREGDERRGRGGRERRCGAGGDGGQEGGDWVDAVGMLFATKQGTKGTKVHGREQRKVPS